MDFVIKPVYNIIYSGILLIITYLFFEYKLFHNIEFLEEYHNI